METRWKEMENIVEKDCYFLSNKLKKDYVFGKNSLKSKNMETAEAEIIFISCSLFNLHSKCIQF